MREDGGRARHSLLQQQVRGAKRRIGGEAALHRAALQEVEERQEGHGLVVRHVRSDGDAVAAAGQTRGRVVDRLVEAVGAEPTVALEPLQVVARGLRRDHQRHGAGVGRDDQVIGEATLEAEAGHAERPILVVEVGVGLVVPRLGDAPRDLALATVLDLTLDDAATGLVEDRATIGRHDQQRHEVLEHRAAPRQQHRLAARGRQGPPEAKPVLLR